MAIIKLLRSVVKKPLVTMSTRSFSKYLPISKPSSTPLDIPILATFNMDTITPESYKHEFESVLSHFSVLRPDEPYRVVRPANKACVDSYFNIKFQHGSNHFLGLYGFFDYWPLAVQSGSKMLVINQTNLKDVLPQIFMSRDVVFLPVGFSGYRTRFIGLGIACMIENKGCCVDAMYMKVYKLFCWLCEGIHVFERRGGARGLGYVTSLHAYTDKSRLMGPQIIADDALNP
ncbi:hypothetical protein POM88_051360 [Heracleum sosnowskyi]|uniref:Uncharacterized protein n=1 Tax=Heracleum sosnowskyi TaxID=360622 RepID=A0AAD8H0A8_9APIA|nr:hypothetical protein POM88_051360 [Heracleum sosnowskyi]